MRNILLAVTLLGSACGTFSSRTTLPVATRDQVLDHYMRGESLEALAAEFHLYGRDDARAAVHDAMIALTKRYYNDN
jgi:hypothetical protein